MREDYPYHGPGKRYPFKLYDSLTAANIRIIALENREGALNNEVDRQARRLAVALAALRWYADTENYGSRCCDDGDGHCDYMPSEVEEDEGQKARDALKYQDIPS
jgi:hypothetical protein